MLLINPKAYYIIAVMFTQFRRPPLTGVTCRYLLCHNLFEVPARFRWTAIVEIRNSHLTETMRYPMLEAAFSETAGWPKL